MKIGGHVSIAGGIEKAPERASSIGANCAQIFVSAPQGWRKFNITNEQTATNIYPFSQLPDNTTNPLWDQVVAYQAPRSGRVTLSYDF